MSTKNGLKKYNGVVPAPSHPNLITSLRAQLKSTAATEVGIGSASLQGSAVGVFTTDGYDPNGGKPIQFDASISGNATAFDTNGWIHMEMTPDYNNGTNPAAGVYSGPVGRSGAAYFFSSASTGSFGAAGAVKAGINWASSGSSGLFTPYLNGIAVPGSPFYIYGHDKTGTADNYVDIIWRASTYMDIYWSGLLVSRQVYPATHSAGADIFKYQCPAGQTNGTATNGAKMRNFFAMPTPQTTIMDTSGAILHIGDSQTVTQGLPSTFYDLPETGADNVAVRLPWAPKNGLTTGGGNPACNGFLAGGVTDGGPSTLGDVGLISAFYRKLGKAGWMPSNNKNYAVAGESSSAMVTQFNTAMAAYAGVVPAVLTALFGTNDYISMGGAASTDTTSFTTNCQALITAAYNAGIPKMIMWTIPEGGTATEYVGVAAYEAALAALNVAVWALPAWSLSQGYGADFLSIYDCFTAMGGLTVDTDSFIARTVPLTNVHLSAQGGTTAGQGIGDIVANWWYSTTGSSRTIMSFPLS